METVVEAEGDGENGLQWHMDLQKESPVPLLAYPGDRSGGPSKSVGEFKDKVGS